MWNFNNVGRVIGETLLHRGLVARHTKVWPWKRKSVSEGMRYLVTVTNPQGIEVYNHSHSHKVLFSYVVNKYLEEISPLKSWNDLLDIRAFSMGTAVEHYLSPSLPDGRYLVMVPLNKRISEAFWKTKADDVAMDHEDPRLDCYVANVTAFEGSLSILIEDSSKIYPGRYFLVEMRDGHAYSTEDLT